MESRPSDEMLLLAVADRDMGAFRTHYGRHAGWLAIRLTRRCNDRDLVTKRIRAMSGGQRRRVALAQAPLGSPVLILDEPTSGVDPEQRVTLRTVLAEIARTSIVVLSTPPDPGRRGPVRTRHRAGPGPGPLRRPGHRTRPPGRRPAEEVAS